jgi:PAS domain S-box-containing protein
MERQRLALEQHARVLEHIADGVFLVGGDGTIQLWNEAAGAITGVAADRAVGRHVADVFRGWPELEQMIPVSRVPGAAADEPRSIPVDVDDHETWISVSAVEFDDGVAYAFRSLNAERALDELRDDFVATVSHELKTPLTAIYGAAETLRAREGDLGKEQRLELLGTIADEAERLAHIVGEILLAGQLDSGRLRLESRSIDPLEAAGDALERLRPQARDAAVRLVASPPLPAVRADAARLGQVLDNLLENAVKYSSGRPRIELSLECVAQHVRFAVRDHGLGIPGDEIPRIFGKFYRVDPLLSGGVAGTGLGLYICRELAHRMGGRIAVESGVGRGSTFTLDLPVATPAGDAAGDEASAQDASTEDLLDELRYRSSLPRAP